MGKLSSPFDKAEGREPLTPPLFQARTGVTPERIHQFSSERITSRRSLRMGTKGSPAPEAENRYGPRGGGLFSMPGLPSRPSGHEARSFGYAGPLPSRSSIHSVPTIRGSFTADEVPNRIAPNGTSSRPPIRFWNELVSVVAFYAVYTLVRDGFGSNSAQARTNALAEIGVERALGIFREASTQHDVLAHRDWIAAANLFYGTAHFVAPIGLMLMVFFQFPAWYRLARNALGWITVLSLLIYAAFPVMPPRLLPKSFGFVDTIKSIGGLPRQLTFLMKEGGNTFASMPSVHVAWAVWFLTVVMLVSERLRFRALALMFPVLTAVAVVITGNHYFFDVLAGIIVCDLGFFCAFAQERWGGTWRVLRVPAALPTPRSHPDPADDHPGAESPRRSARRRLPISLRTLDPLRLHPGRAKLKASVNERPR
jgi:membrane-associated phospholipid phosphatase